MSAAKSANRSLNVFEGIKGYWQPNGQFGILQLKRHYERLCRSARLLQIPFDHSLDQYRDAIFELMGVLLKPDKDMWARTTLFAIEGHSGRRDGNRYGRDSLSSG